MRHVALVIETSGSYGRGLLTGIAKYNRQRGGWSTYFRPHGPGDPPPDWLEGWKGDGMLARIETPAMAQIAKRLGVPVVSLRSTVTSTAFPYVGADNVAVGEMAAEHLLHRGLKNFAFCGTTSGVNPALDQRGEAFRASVERAGGTFCLFATDEAAIQLGWPEQQRLAEWIESLPKPLGIMACNDERGLQVLDACRRGGMNVPEDVAVIGVDNDEPLCELSIPPLSSIDVNAEGIGYEAAALLDRMMSGRKAPAKPIKLAPRGVVTRRSTDVVACNDEEVSRALRYIREHACGGIQVSDVANFMGMSRASLQQRIKQVAGHTIHDEIQRERLARVKEQLVRSDKTIKQVAREGGFASVQYMTRVFRAATGETPARYRSRRKT